MFRHLRQGFIAISLASCLVAGAIVAFPPAVAQAAPTGAPAISVSPGSPQTGGAVAPKASITVTGTGFGASETITISVNGQTLTTSPSPLVTTSAGAFSGVSTAPNLTARTYPLVAVGQTSGLRATFILWLKASAQNVYSPTSGAATYQISDADSREPQMSYLRITNTGDANLVNPAILPDTLQGQDAVVNLNSVQSIVQGILAANPNATTDEQKTQALWLWLTDYSYHAVDAQDPNVQPQPDAAAIMNNYGYTRCFNHARILADFFQAAGYQARTTNLNGHAVAEVSYGGAWHMYDADEEKYFVGPDGTSVLDAPSLTLNPHPIFLNVNPGGVAYHYTAQYMANMYATTGDNAPLANTYPAATHPMGLTLRKNESLMEYWSNIGKYHDNYLHTKPPVFTNGDIVYTPDLSLASYATGVTSQTNVSGSSQDGQRPNLHAQTAGAASAVVYQVTSPYTLVGSLLNAETYRATSSDTVSIYFSLDGTNWGNPVYTQSTLGYDAPQLDLSTLLNNGTLPEEYQYYLKFAWTAASSSAGAGVDSFNLDSQFEQAWEAIPPIHSGTTTVAYSDQNGAAHASGDVQVAYGWSPQSTPSNLSGSTLTADYTSIPANGTTFANVSLTLKTSTGSTVSNMYVQLAASGGSPLIQRTYVNQGLRGVTDSKGLATFEVRSTQTGAITLTATDKNGASLGIAPLTLNFTTPAAQPTLTTSEGGAVVNGGFETGTLSGWTPGGTVAPTIETTQVHSGVYAAQLGAVTQASTADSSLLETLTIPSATNTLKLAYLMVNPSADSGDYLVVQVRDTAGEVLAQFSSTSQNSSGWQTSSLTLMNKYRGNTVQLYFDLHHDNTSNQAYAYVDDVALG